MPATTRSNQVAANAAADNVEEIYADGNDLDEEEPRRVRSREEVELEGPQEDNSPWQVAKFQEM